MKQYDEIAPKVLENNPVLQSFVAYLLQCAARRKRTATSSDFQAADAKVAAPQLVEMIRKAPNSGAAVNCLEAATAVEVCIDNLEIYRPIAVQAIRQAYRLARRERKSPPTPQQFVVLMCERAFRGPVWGLSRPIYYQRPLLYPSDWHRSRKEDMRNLLQSFLTHEQIEGAAWHKVITEVFDDKAARPAPVRGQKSYVNTSGPFQLRHVWLAWIGSQAELEFVTQGLANLEQERLPAARGDELYNRGLGMFGDALTYLATKRMIPNAQAIYTTLFGETIAPVEIMKLLTLAERLAGSAPPEWLGVRPVLRVPWGMEVVGDTIAFRGDNALSPQERDNVALYFRLAGDLCVVGEYLRDRLYERRTVGEYLADHPRVDPGVLADRINQPKGTTDSNLAYLKARQHFGSSYFLGRNRKGWGFNS